MESCATVGVTEAVSVELPKTGWRLLGENATKQYVVGYVELTDPTARLTQHYINILQ